MSFKLSWFTDNDKIMPQIRIEGGSGSINLMSLKHMLSQKADAFGILLRFQDNTLESGSLFNKQSEPILVVDNAEHPEYAGLMFRVQYRGTYAFIDIYQVGSSTNLKHENSNSAGRKIMNMMSGHKQKLEEEKEYYSIINHIIEQIFHEICE